MIDDIVYINLRPSSSWLYTINTLGYALGLIIYHIKHKQVYVYYTFLLPYR